MTKKIIIALIIVAVAILAFFLLKKTPPVQAPINENIPETGPVNNTPTEEVEPVPTSTPPTTTAETKPLDLSQYKTPIMIIDQNKGYVAKMKTTAGDMEIALNVKSTPITANNFVFLAKKNFYDNVIFHRTIPGFMIQGGDPTGTGSGGPGYKFDDEPFKGEYLKGTVAMANSGPNTNGSQFFIMHDDYPLPPNYVIFGQVVKGLDVIDKIAQAPVKMSPSGENSQPVNPVKILSVEIVEN